LLLPRPRLRVDVNREVDFSLRSGVRLHCRAGLFLRLFEKYWLLDDRLEPRRREQASELAVGRRISNRHCSCAGIDRRLVERCLLLWRAKTLFRIATPFMRVAAVAAVAVSDITTAMSILEAEATARGAGYSKELREYPQ
jgi:hypothetical protein